MCLAILATIFGGSQRFFSNLTSQAYFLARLHIILGSLSMLSGYFVFII